MSCSYNIAASNTWDYQIAASGTWYYQIVASCPSVEKSSLITKPGGLFITTKDGRQITTKT